MFACSTILASAADLGLMAEGGALVAAAPGFDPKAQAEGLLRLHAGIPLSEHAGCIVALLLAGASPSNADGWYVYRGWGGVGLELGGSASWALASWSAGSLRLGLEAGAGGALLRYCRTTLSFFSPLLRVAGIASFTPAELPFVEVRLALPVLAWVRADMDVAVSIALGLGVVYSPRGYAAWRARQLAAPAREAAP